MQHFDVAVIGSGSGNTIINERLAHLEVALIEENPVFGGTCLNRGCIPTKMFVTTSEAATFPARARRLGVDLELKGVSWPEVRDRIFGRIDPVSESGKEWRRRGSGVTLFEGRAEFVDPHTLRIGDVSISADQIVIATGSRPRPLDVAVPPGLEGLIHTSDDVMRLEELPRRLVVVGGGYVACELAQVFAGLGSQVTQLNRSEVLLRGQDREVAEAFTVEHAKRVNLILNQRVSEIVEGPDQAAIVVTVDRNGVEYEYPADAVLVATGRIRNSELNLEAAGVDVDEHGQVRVDRHQRTSQPHIWALGDVSTGQMLKHVANAEARTVAQNLLVGDGELAATDHRYVPSAVFTDPQIASVGATEEQLRDWGAPYVVARHDFADVAYGWALEDEGQHFVKLLADPRTWHLLGAHIIGPDAALLIQPLIQAMSFGLTVPEMARGQYWIHPALTEVVENALLDLLKNHRAKEIGEPLTRS
ncbi:mycothione reductase [Arachnia propionica]|uniref:Mycothione reductase n=1 Tax=Arachnia propionica TaxID=1750 RepID=A0A3P1T9G5_9ACTN|nr:mycothione reductase [Arachnia propionica]MDO5083213.1 mycothione reductase [Arachnia propionica]RRD05506.1 mycothione reductase [Arachnia propionica]